MLFKITFHQVLRHVVHHCFIFFFLQNCFIFLQTWTNEELDKFFFHRALYMECTYMFSLTTMCFEIIRVNKLLFCLVWLCLMFCSGNRLGERIKLFRRSFDFRILYQGWIEIPREICGRETGTFQTSTTLFFNWFFCLIDWLI